MADGETRVIFKTPIKLESHEIEWNGKPFDCRQCSFLGCCGTDLGDENRDKCYKCACQAFFKQDKDKKVPCQLMTEYQDACGKRGGCYTHGYLENGPSNEVKQTTMPCKDALALLKENGDTLFNAEEILARCAGHNWKNQYAALHAEDSLTYPVRDPVNPEAYFDKLVKDGTQLAKSPVHIPTKKKEALANLVQKAKKNRKQWKIFLFISLLLIAVGLGFTALCVHKHKHTNKKDQFEMVEINI